MVLENNGSLPPSRTPYDKKVARTISGGREYKPRIVLSRQKKKENNTSNKTRMTVILVRKVYCKVDATISIEI